MLIYACFCMNKEIKFQDKQEEGNMERADHTKEHMGLTT